MGGQLFEAKDNVTTWYQPQVNDMVESLQLCTIRPKKCSNTNWRHKGTLAHAVGPSQNLQGWSLGYANRYGFEHFSLAPWRVHFSTRFTLQSQRFCHWPLRASSYPPRSGDLTRKLPAIEIANASSTDQLKPAFLDFTDQLPTLMKSVAPSEPPALLSIQLFVQIRSTPSASIPESE